MTGAELLETIHRRGIAHLELARKVVAIAEQGRECKCPKRRDSLIQESMRLSQALNAELYRTNQMAHQCVALGIDIEIVSLVQTATAESVSQVFMGLPRRLGRVPTVCAN
jgi:hypothetical protein